MVCIYCGGKTDVTNSRPQKRLNHVWRRRQCRTCHALFTTEESAQLSTSLVVRRPQAAVQPFSRDKLFVSVLRAVGHRETPVDDAAALTATIIAKLLHRDASAALSRADITTATYDTLRHFDSAAAVQYRAYHKADVR